jgi:hypothetical protein
MAQMMQMMMGILPSTLIVCAVSSIVMVTFKGTCNYAGPMKDMCESISQPKTGLVLAIGSFVVAMAMVFLSGFSMMGSGMGMGMGMGGYY